MKEASDLAANLIFFRQKRNLSQVQLAELSQLPRSTIAHLESGSGNPTLSSLLKLSEVFQLSIEELIAKPFSNATLTRAKDIPIESKAKGLVNIHKLLPDPIPGAEIDKIEILVDGIKKGQPHLPGTKEFFCCIEGQFQVGVAGKIFRVKKGDVLSFWGDQVHSYKNGGNKKATAISVVLQAK